MKIIINQNDKITAYKFMSCNFYDLRWIELFVDHFYAFMIFCLGFSLFISKTHKILRITNKYKYAGSIQETQKRILL